MKNPYEPRTIQWYTCEIERLNKITVTLLIFGAVLNAVSIALIVWRHYHHV
jgi:hypothetical protein